MLLLYANRIWSCTLALSTPLELYNHIFYLSYSLPCIQSTQATKWLELFLFIFQCLMHGSPFVGDKANHLLQDIFETHSGFLIFKHEKVLDNKIPWLLTKMHPCDLEKEFTCSLSLLMSSSWVRFFSWIYTHIYAHSHTHNVMLLLYLHT